MYSKIYHSVRVPLLGGVLLLILFALVGIKYERRVAATSQSVAVEIEVLPREASKLIDISTRSRVPVAILGSADFDAARVNPASVRLAGAPITKGKNGQLRVSLEDVNGDGRIDLVVYVSAYSLRLDPGTSEALLTASTFDGESVSGSQQVSFSRPVTQDMPDTVGAQSGSFSNPKSIFIDDTLPKPTSASPYPRGIDVSGQATVNKLTVTITNIKHTFQDDVDILLVGPTGATCLLMADCGGSAANFDSPSTLTFDDSAASFLPDEALPDLTGWPVSGSFKPTRGTASGTNPVPASFPSPAPPGPYGTTLAAFNGTSPNGSWSLYVIDDTSGDEGFIDNGWSLTINTGAAPAYQGFHDGAGCNSISGWAWDANSPNSTVNVDFYDGNTLIGTAPANMYREDLLNALGSPNHGFSFLTPAGLKNGAVHSINVKFSGTNTLLANTNRTIQCSLAPAFNGRHDGQGCNAIEGWAWDGNDRNGTVNVDIYDGPTLIGTVAATLYRQDLADVFGSPYHGFIFHTPASLRDGQPHTVTVKFGGTNTNLPLNTPRTTSCTSSTPNYQGSHDVADCNFISGYAWDANDNEGTINAAIYVDGNFHVVVPAQQTYPGVGSGFHGFKYAVPAFLKNGQPHSIQVRFSGTAIPLTGTPKTINCSGP